MCTLYYYFSLIGEARTYFGVEGGGAERETLAIFSGSLSIITFDATTSISYFSKVKRGVSAPSSLAQA